MIVMGIETSCDDTAVGIVDDQRRILANVVASQTREHQPYGGVVPEIAARAHLDIIDDLVREALRQAGMDFDQLAGIAATCGPGLIGGVMVGAMTGKAIAAARHLPFIGVNHLEAHALTPRLSDNVAFPYLLMLLSGGHSQILLAEGIGSYTRLGGTIDDAVGECFDKGAKLLGLGYPGGPLVERAATNGNAKAIDLPRPMLGREGCDFSFSGLKTALRLTVEKHHSQIDETIPSPLRGGSGRGESNKNETPALPMALSPNPSCEGRGNFTSDAAASLQTAIADILADRAEHALEMTQDRHPTALVVAGGVAANQAIRARLHQVAAQHDLPFVAPPLALCTDNGAMVAWAGVERLRLGLTDDLSIAARPRWPLDTLAQKTGTR
jgi:N6-L-threonylcarbamoyladenine synthase